MNQHGQTTHKPADSAEKSLADKWAEEMSGGATKPADEDFWKVLEKQWDDMSR